MSNLLPLETFRQILSFHPWHFWGFSNSVVPVTSSCDTVVREYAYQMADAAGRAEIRDAIENAEALLRRELRYSVAPRYTTETVPWPRYHDAALTRTSASDARGRRLSVQLPEGHIQAIGTEALALIATANVTLSDVDGDGLNDTFTISAATTVTDIAQIAVYFAAADRYDGTAASDRWRILPIRVTISAGTVTIKGAAWLLADPVRYEGFSTSDLDPATSANFAATLDIYQRTTETNGTTAATSQAVIIWETDPAAGWACCGSSDVSSVYSGSPYDPAAVAQGIAHVGIRDGTNGIVTPAESAYNSTTGIWSSLDWSVCAEPDRVLVRYLAGLALQSDGQMQREWQVVAARLAAAELGRPVCGCEPANRELYRWQLDLARTGGNNDEQFGAISAEDLSNPLGTRRGHIYAWRRIMQARQLHGFQL